MATTAADCVNFINENQTGRILASLLEHVPYTAGAHAHEHLDEIGAADAEESRIGFAGNRFGQKGLARAGGAHHQNAFGNTTTEALKLFGVFEELHQLGDLFDGFIDTGNVFEGGLVSFLGQQTCFAFAEAERAFTGHLDLANEEEPNEHPDEYERQHAQEHAEEKLTRFLRLKNSRCEQPVLHDFRQAHLRAEIDF